jgi:hypothetical protein
MNIYIKLYEQFVSDELSDDELDNLFIDLGVNIFDWRSESGLILRDLGISKDNINIRGDLDLRSTQITALPINLTVGGNLNLANTQITKIPKTTKIGGRTIK